MDILPIELLLQVGYHADGIWSLMMLARTGQDLYSLLHSHITKEKRKYMLMSTGLTQGIMPYFTGIYAKAVQVNDNGCIMAIGIDGYCYVSGKKIRLSLKEASGGEWSRVSSKRVKQIINRDYFSLYITEDDELWGWGVNREGIFNQFSNPFRHLHSMKSLDKPIMLKGVAGSSVAATETYIAFLLEDGYIIIKNRRFTVSIDKLISSRTSIFGIGVNGDVYEVNPTNIKPVEFDIKNNSLNIYNYRSTSANIKRITQDNKAIEIFLRRVGVIGTTHKFRTDIVNMASSIFNRHDMIVYSDGSCEVTKGCVPYFLMEKFNCYDIRAPDVLSATQVIIAYIGM